MDTPRFLITMYTGIGDAVSVGLSAVDQIIKNDPQAYGKIDVLCDVLQAQIVEYDPRIHTIISVSKMLFPPPEVTAWLKGIIMNTELAKLVHFLQNREYEAVFPGMFAPGLHCRLDAHVMYPSLFKLGREFLALRAQMDRPMRTIVRQMVNRSFDKNLPGSAVEEIPLYISSEHI